MFRTTINNALTNCNNVVNHINKHSIYRTLSVSTHNNNSNSGNNINQQHNRQKQQPIQCYKYSEYDLSNQPYEYYNTIQKLYSDNSFTKHTYNTILPTTQSVSIYDIAKSNNPYAIDIMFPLLKSQQNNKYKTHNTHNDIQFSRQQHQQQTNLENLIKNINISDNIDTTTTTVPLVDESKSNTDNSLELVKRTYQPHLVKRKRTHGFLNRLRSRNGRKVLNRRRNKGRKFLAV